MTEQANWSNTLGPRIFFGLYKKQEEGHKRKLEEVLAGKIVLGKIEKIPNLKISDYMVEAELKPDISYGDIPRTAMKREERSVKLYTDLNQKNQDENLQESLHLFGSRRRASTSIT